MVIDIKHKMLKIALKVYFIFIYTIKIKKGTKSTLSTLKLPFVTY